MVRSLKTMCEPDTIVCSPLEKHHGKEVDRRPSRGNSRTGKTTSRSRRFRPLEAEIAARTRQVALDRILDDEPRRALIDILNVSRQEMEAIDDKPEAQPGAGKDALPEDSNPTDGENPPSRSSEPKADGAAKKKPTRKGRSATQSRTG